MPSSLKLFWLSFVLLLPPLWISFIAQSLLQEIALHHCPFTPQHRLDQTWSHLWPKATFCQRANTIMGDTDVKESTPISPHDFPPWDLFPSHGPPWVPHCSSTGPIWGWLRRGTGWAELECGRVLWSALQHLTSPRLRETPSCPRNCATSSLVGVTYRHKGWCLLRGLNSL